MTKKALAHRVTKADSHDSRTAGKVKATRRPKAKTAYELLQRVCAAIKQEPRAYDQSLWVIDRELMNDPGDLYARPEELQPPCGTSFCVAGHVVAQHDGRKSAAGQGFGIQERAIEILGFDVDRTRPLFRAGALGLHTPPAGTPAYAALGIELVREFMAEHEAHLKARSLRGA